MKLYIVDSAKCFQAKSHARIDPWSDSFEGYPIVVFFRNEKLIDRIHPKSIEEIIEKADDLNKRHEQKLLGDLEAISFS